MRKYNANFERDYAFYLRMVEVFTFDGASQYIDKKGRNIIVDNHNGVDAKEAFYQYDSNGKIIATFEPDKLRLLLRTKGSINLHIKMYAEDRANGRLPKIEFDEMCELWQVPDWFKSAVERQKHKYYATLRLPIITHAV